MMLRSLLPVLFILFGLSLQAQDREEYLLVISMDGFRWDYPERYGMENVMQFASEGVRAGSLQPAFPSKTFPNHYTLATGLYPENHGIVMNSFYDPVLDAYYKVSDRDAVMDGKFYGGEPIWVTAEKQGIRSASFFWVGSEAPVQGIQPSFWKKYQHSFPYGQRIDTVMHWFSLPTGERPRLVMLYFDEPDGVGHRHGPESHATAVMMARMDSLFGVLLEKARTLPIYHDLNIVLLSDHGMGAIGPGRSIRLDSLIKPEWVKEVQGGNPVYNIMVEEGYIDSVMAVLDATKHLKAWRRGEAPEYLHYRKNPRILDITVAADSSWSIIWGGQRIYSGGTHGYDPRNKDMHAIFMARGPAFREGFVHPSFENVHVYSILAYVLGLTPAPTDGSLQQVRACFR